MVKTQVTINIISTIFYCKQYNIKFKGLISLQTTIVKINSFYKDTIKDTKVIHFTSLN